MRYFYKNVLSTRRRIIVVAVISLALLGYVDYFTGPSVSVTCFYLIPVCLLSWFGGRRFGYFVALTHAFIWLLIDVNWATSPTAAHHAWNALVRFVTFAAVAWIVDACKNLTSRVENLIQEKTAYLEREVENRAVTEEAIHRLANQLSAAEDSQRRHLGQEIHDSFGQSLNLLKLRMESLTATLPPGGTVAEMRECLSVVSTLIQQARTLTFELYPSMLDQLGLTTTLEHYARQLATQSNAHIEIADAGPAMTLPAPVTAFLFRAVKELITNAIKHGPATEILVQIRRRHGHVRVVVNDNGKGFQPEHESADGLGLPSIRERLRFLGGTLDIDSAPNQGARVTLDLPVRPSLAQIGSIPHGQPYAG